MQVMMVKYPWAAAAGAISVNEMVNFVYTLYELHHITCEACDFGCRRGDPGCEQFDFLHEREWCSNLDEICT